MSERSFSAIDLSQLPVPGVVSVPTFDDIVSDIKADVTARMPELGPALELPSEPLAKLIEAYAYRELFMLERINVAGREGLIAFATGANLDHLAANLGAQRLDGESDDDFRERATLALEAYSTAGSQGGYFYHVRTADPRVRHATIVSPEPGEVLITVLSTEGDGTASADLLAKVSDRVNDKFVRPLTDQVTVQAATIVPYQVTARLTVDNGPDPELVRAQAEKAARDYVNSRRAIRRTVARSGLLQALHGAGVTNVDLVSPAADIALTPSEAAHMTALTVTVEAIDA